MEAMTGEGPTSTASDKSVPVTISRVLTLLPVLATLLLYFIETIFQLSNCLVLLYTTIRGIADVSFELLL